MRPGERPRPPRRRARPPRAACRPRGPRPRPAAGSLPNAPGTSAAPAGATPTSRSMTSAGVRRRPEERLEGLGRRGRREDGALRRGRRRSGGRRARPRRGAGPPGPGTSMRSRSGLSKATRARARARSPGPAKRHAHAAAVGRRAASAVSNPLGRRRVTTWRRRWTRPRRSGRRRRGLRVLVLRIEGRLGLVDLLLHEGAVELAVLVFAVQRLAPEDERPPRRCPGASACPRGGRRPRRCSRASSRPGGGAPRPCRGGSAGTRPNPGCRGRPRSRDRGPRPSR